MQNNECESPAHNMPTRESVSVADVFANTGKQMKISLAKVTDPSFKTGDEDAACCECGQSAGFVTYLEEQTRSERARIVKNGLWEVLQSEVEVTGDRSDKQYYCESCFNA